MKATHHPFGIPGASGSFRRVGSAAGICLAIAAWTLGSSIAPADTGALTNAITAKESEIRWKLEDIQKAEREVHAFANFIANHEESSGQLATADGDLERLDGQLASIQQNNLVKLTLRTAYETYKAIKLGSGVGKAAAEKMISTGFVAGIAAGGQEFVKDKMEDQAKAALGVDDNTLLGPRTVKLQGVNAKARAAIPELDRVNRTLALSLEAIQSKVWKEEGEEIGEVGAILRKNLTVREAIETARLKLDELAVEADDALVEAQSNLPAAEAALAELRTELGVLESELATLKNQLQFELMEEQSAETQAKIQAPRDLDPPAVNVYREEEETEAEFIARWIAARAAAASAVWAAESPALIETIGEKQQAILAVIDSIESAAPLASPAYGFTEEFARRPVYSTATLVSLSGSASEAARITDMLDESGGWSSAVSGMVALHEQACTAHAELQDAHNRLIELIDMVGEVTARPVVDESVWIHPGDLSGNVNQVGFYQTILDRLPIALSNASSALNQLVSAYNTVGAATAAAHLDLDAELAAAETALSRLVSTGAQWQSALAAIPEANNATANIRYGVWTGPISDSANFQPTLSRRFSQTPYSLALANLITAGNYDAARELRGRYLAFDAASKSLEIQYADAWQEFDTAWSVLKRAASAQGFSTLADWAGAGSAFPDRSGIPSTNDARNSRLVRIANTAQFTAADYSQSPWIWNYGFGKLSRLYAATLDDPGTMVVHRLLDILDRIDAAKTDWMDDIPSDFDEAYYALWAEANAIVQDHFDLLHSEVPADDYIGWLGQGYLDAHKNAIQATYPEILSLSTAYDEEHPAPVITGRSANVEAVVEPGATFRTTLSISSTGDYRTYQWQTTQWPDYEYTWEDISGATGSSLTTPLVTPTGWDSWYYRCIVTNRAGSDVSEAIQVSVTVDYPEPVITSPDTANAEVGTPFAWQFEATENPHWWSAHVFFEGGIPGLSFDSETGRITGTPTAGGVYVFPVVAFATGGSAGMQQFVLTIEGPGADYASWVENHFTTEEIASGLVTGSMQSPAGDRVPNLVKFAMGRAPWDAVESELAALLPQADGSFVFRYVHDTASAARIVIQSSPNLGGPWSDFEPDAAAVTDYAIGGSRMEREVRLAKPTARAGFYRLNISLPE